MKDAAQLSKGAGVTLKNPWLLSMVVIMTYVWIAKSLLTLKGTMTHALATTCEGKE